MIVAYHPQRRRIHAHNRSHIRHEHNPLVQPKPGHGFPVEPLMNAGHDKAKMNNANKKFNKNIDKYEKKILEKYSYTYTHKQEKRRLPHA